MYVMMSSGCDYCKSVPGLFTGCHVQNAVKWCSNRSDSIMELSSCHSYCQSLPGLFGDCGTAFYVFSAFRLSQPAWLTAGLPIDCCSICTHYTDICRVTSDDAALKVLEFFPIFQGPGKTLKRPQGLESLGIWCDRPWKSSKFKLSQVKII